MTSPEATHSSEEVNYGTPLDIIAAGTKLLGGAIDLDPASCDEFNENVKATSYYNAVSNGFLRRWWGRVLLNPPGGWCDTRGQRVIKRRKGIGPCTETGECGLPPGHTHDACLSATKEWWKKLAVEWESGNVQQALFVGFNQGILQTSQVDRGDYSICLDFPCCWPSTRLAYLRLDGTPANSPPQTSVLVYLPPVGLPPVEAVRLMRRTFRDIGAVR